MIILYKYFNWASIITFLICIVLLSVFHFYFLAWFWLAGPVLIAVIIIIIIIIIIINIIK